MRIRSSCHPKALLGKEPIVTDRFPLTFDGNSTQPPWSALVRSLTEEVGVEAVKVVEEIRLVPQHTGWTVTVYVQQFERAVEVTYNQMSVSAGDLVCRVRDLGSGPWASSQASLRGSVEWASKSSFHGMS